MKRYMLTIYQPDGPPPPPEVLDPIMERMDAIGQELRDSGAWVFNAGLHPPSASTVVQLKGDEVLTTDGPYLEGKEFIGGFTVIQAPDLDAALEWGRKVAEALTLPIEVRPLYDDADSCT